MVEVFIFWSSNVPNAPPKRRASSARVKRTDAIGVKRRSGQGSRWLVGRWTGQTVAEQVVRNQMSGLDRVPQREGGGLGGARLGRLQDAHRNQRAVLTVLALLLVGATGHVGRHRHVAPAVRASLRGCRRRRQRQTGGH